MSKPVRKDCIHKDDGMDRESWLAPFTMCGNQSWNVSKSWAGVNCKKCLKYGGYAIPTTKELEG